MMIKIHETECVGFEDSILPDIGRFKDLPSWLIALQNQDVAYYPLDCGVKVGEKIYYVIQCGHVTGDMATAIKDVKKLPASFRNLPNDSLVIIADPFERQLSFNTNY